MSITPVEMSQVNPLLSASDKGVRQNPAPVRDAFQFPEKSQKTRGEYAGQESNPAMEMLPTTLSFSLDESTKRVVIKVYDASTHELIRQIPPEETLRIAKEILKAMNGHFDQTV